MIKYIEELKGKGEGYKTNTFNTKVNSLTSFNNYLRDKQLIEKNIVFGKDKIQSSNNKEVDVYSEHEMKLIEAYLESDTINQKDRLIIKILRDLGLRVSELTNLKLEDIDVVGLEIEVHGKNNKIRRLPIKSSLAEEIREYISGNRKDNKHSSSSPYLLVSERANKLHRNTILDTVKRMGEELGIEAYNHKFRHSLATSMANNNTPIHLIQAVLGHSQIQTTIDYYISVDKDQMREFLDKV